MRKVEGTLNWHCQRMLRTGGTADPRWRVYLATGSPHDTCSNEQNIVVWQCRTSFKSGTALTAPAAPSTPPLERSANKAFSQQQMLLCSVHLLETIYTVEWQNGSWTMLKLRKRWSRLNVPLEGTEKCTQKCKQGRCCYIECVIHWSINYQVHIPISTVVSLPFI